MPYSNLVINPNAGSVPSFGSIDSNQWSLGNAVQSSNNVGSNGSAFGGLMSGLLSGGIGAVGSLIGSGLNALFAKKAAERQFKMNKQLMQFQNEMQRDMLMDEMALKMQGYKKAGLSTASLAGNFSNNTAVPSQSVGSSQATAHDMRLGDIFNVARQVKLQEMAIESQIRVNEAQANALNSNARKNTADAIVTEGYGVPTASQNLKNMQAQVRHLDADIAFLNEKTRTEPVARRSIFKSIQLTDKQIQAIDMQYDIEYRKLNPYIQNLLANAYMASQTGRNQKAQAERSEQLLEGDLQIQGIEVRKLNQEVVNLATENHLKGENILYLASLREKAMAEKNWIQKKTAEQEFHNEVLRLCGPELFYNREKMQNMNLRLDNINKGIQAVDNSIQTVGSAFGM